MPGAKKNRQSSEERINQLRLIGDTRRTTEQLNKRNEKDHFDMLVRSEIVIEDYMYVHGSATSAESNHVAELKTARKNLEAIISNHKTKADAKPHQKTIALEARILMMKLMHIFGEVNKIDLHFSEKDFTEAINTFTKESNTRMLKLVAEAFAIKGLQMEQKMSSQDTSSHLAKSPEENGRKYFELSSNACLSFLKCLDGISFPNPSSGLGSAAISPTGTMAQNSSGGPAVSPLSMQMNNSTAPSVSNFLEYAVHRVPSMLFLEGNISGSVAKLRDYLQKPEIRHSSDLRALLARQLAEILLRFVSESSYSALLNPNRFAVLGRITTEDLSAALASPLGGKNSANMLSRSLNAQSNASISHSSTNLNKMRSSRHYNMDAGECNQELYVPQNKTEEILLLLLITEALISKELVLDMATDHSVLREKKLAEEKFVVDLLTIVLINGQQYSLLSQAVERGMSVAFEDKEMWFKFGLSLISAQKYARAIVVLEECAKIDPDNYIYHSLIAKVALQNLREPSLGIASLNKALQIAESNDEVTCYEEAKMYVLLAIAYAMKAEISTVNINDKHLAWELARNHFAKAYELDDMDPCIAYNYALCLAKARRISEACRLIRNFEDYPPAQELNILLLTSMKKYQDALELVTSYIGGSSENITLLFLKISIEEKLFGPSMAAKNLKSLAVHLTNLGFPSFNFNDSQSVLGLPVERQLSTASGGGTMGTLTRDNTALTLGRSQQSDFFSLKNNASLDGWNEAQFPRNVPILGTSAASTSYLDNFTMSDGMASSVESPRQGSQTLTSLSPEDDVNLNIWILMFEFFVKMKNLAEAKSCLQEFTKCIRSEGAMYHFHYANGILAEEEDQLQECKNFYKQALIFNPRGIDARLRLAGCMKKESSLECAEKALRECIQMNPYDEKSWGLLGEILMEKGDQTGASECLRTACNLERNSPIKAFDNLLNWAF